MPMRIELSVVARKRVGMLAQIASEIFREGFQLLDQKITTLKDPEFYDLTLTLEGPEPAAAPLAARLEALDGVIKVQNGSPPAASVHAAVEDVETRLKAAFMEVVDAFPHIAGPVQKFASSLAGAGRKEAMFRLGQRVGRSEYKKKFSLGSPLKLDLALRRMVAPALRPFAQAAVDGTTLRVTSCPFCVNLRAAEPCCDFLAGFVQGLLDANPATPGLRAKELRCKACGDAECAISCAPVRA